MEDVEEESGSFVGDGLDALVLRDQLKKDRREELRLDVVEELAVKFQDSMNQELVVRDELRTVSRELERATKHVAHILQRIHLDAESDEQTRAIGQKAEEYLKTEVASIIQRCGSKIPAKEYYKYADFFRGHLIKSVFCVVLSKFLVDGGDLATIQQVADVLQIPSVEDKDRDENAIFLEWEGYLEGCIDVAQELARLAKNCVILDNVKLVGLIHSFISTLNYGFSGMNFKNDGLRRRYDSLKYHSRAIEEVVYDLKMQKKDAL